MRPYIANIWGYSVLQIPVYDTQTIEVYTQTDSFSNNGCRILLYRYRFVLLLKLQYEGYKNIRYFSELRKSASRANILAEHSLILSFFAKQTYLFLGYLYWSANLLFRSSCSIIMLYSYSPRVFAICWEGHFASGSLITWSLIT